jgi:hypothetical protein
MPLYRICWIDQTGPDPTRKSTRPITLGLAYDVLDRLLSDGIRAWAVRQRPDGRWTRIGAPTPARGRTVTIGPDDIGLGR